MGDFTTLLDKLAAAPTDSMGLHERFLDGLGMMRGPYAPFLRVGFGFGLVSLVLWAVRSRYFFDGAGRPLPWSSDGSRGTRFPWWAAASAGGLFMGIFI